METALGGKSVAEGEKQTGRDRMNLIFPTSSSKANFALAWYEAPRTCYKTLEDRQQVVEMPVRFGIRCLHLTRMTK